MRYVILFLLLAVGSLAFAGDMSWGVARGPNQLGVVRIAPSGGGAAGDVIAVGDSRLSGSGGASNVQKAVVAVPAGVLSQTIALSPALLDTSYSVTVTPATTFLMTAIGTKRTTSFDALLEWNGAGVTINAIVVP